MTEQVRMIIDCDTGIDDAMAIAVALSQSNVDLLAITCVSGNTGLTNVLRNTLRVIGLCKRKEIPVYRGASTSLLGLRVFNAKHVHGGDGLGNIPDPDPPSLDLVQSEHAVHALIRMTREQPGQLTLLAIGPLTNVALAVRMDPGFTARLKKLVIMGGNTEGSGSMTDAAEFNFCMDPEAARIVLHHTQCPTVVVGWETCLNNGLPWEWYDTFCRSSTPKAQFLRAILEAFVPIIIGRKTFTLCDALALAVAVRPDMVLEEVTCSVQVELQGTVTRGQMVKRMKNAEGLPLGPKVSLVLRCDTSIWQRMMEDAVEDRGLNDIMP